MPRNDDWSFEANLNRGHLPTGEPLCALYGHGWWDKEPGWEAEEPSPLDLIPVVQCHVCDGHAYDLGDEIDCENCGVIVNPEYNREIEF